MRLPYIRQEFWADMASATDDAEYLSVETSKTKRYGTITACDLMNNTVLVKYCLFGLSAKAYSVKLEVITERLADSSGFLCYQTEPHRVKFDLRKASVTVAFLDKEFFW